jgi:hypothetical protein
MWFKRHPGKNGSLQRNMEKTERRGVKAYHRAYGSKKKRIRAKAWRTYKQSTDAMSAYLYNCYFGDN